MLTKSDLDAIGNSIDKRLDKRFQESEARLDKKLDEKLKPINDDISHIRKDMKMLVNFFDREYLELRKRVERIEQKLGLSPIS